MLRYVALTAAFVSLRIIGSLDAQQPTTPVPTPAVKRTALQKVEVAGSNYAEVLGIAEFMPNAKGLSHSDPGTVLADVVEGAFLLAPDGQPQRTHKAGQSLQVPDRAIHSEGTTDKPAKVMAVYVVEKGKPLVQPAQ